MVERTGVPGPPGGAKARPLHTAASCPAPHWYSRRMVWKRCKFAQKLAWSIGTLRGAPPRTAQLHLEGPEPSVRHAPEHSVAVDGVKRPCSGVKRPCSGSATARALCARALRRLGIPVLLPRCQSATPEDSVARYLKSSTPFQRLASIQCLGNTVSPAVAC